MKRHFILLLLILVSAHLLTYQISLLDDANESVFEATESNANYAQIEFSLADFKVEDIDVNNRTFQKLYHPEAFYSMDEGLPALPMFAASIAIPNTGSAELEILNSEQQIVRDMLVAPYFDFEDPKDTPNHKIDEKYYSTGVASQKTIYMPTELATISKPSILRDYRLVTIKVNPFSYNPVTKELTVKKRISIRVNFTNTQDENELVSVPQKQSRSFQRLYDGILLNYDFVRDEDPDFQNRSLLIIYINNDDVLTYVEALAEWKRNKGFVVEIASTSSSEAGSSSSSVKSYIQTAYNTWENPPEYLMLVGEASSPSFEVPVAGAQGDHAYSQLNGNDPYPELFIGRLSIQEAADMETYLAKIGLSEITPPVLPAGDDYFNRSFIFGDANHNSGLSTYLTCVYAEDMILSADPDHTFEEWFGYGDNETYMKNQLDVGNLFFCYRGWLGMSGFSTTEINSLTNIGQPTYGVMLTCSSGTITSTAQSNTEELARAGTGGSPTGTYSSIGLATSSTKTQYNNIETGGIFGGLFGNNMPNFGEANMRGKLALVQAFWTINQTKVESYLDWTNLIGDPTMEVWKGDPKYLSVAHTDVVPLGSNHIEITVTDATNAWLKDAWVTIRRGDDIFATGYTNAVGKIVLEYDGSVAGDVSVVVSKPLYVPYQGTFNISSEGGINVNQLVIDDDGTAPSNGNGNGIAEPGETVELVVNMANQSNSDYTAISADIIVNDEYATATATQVTFGDITSGANADGQATYVLEIAEDIPHNHSIDVEFEISDDSNNTWKVLKHVIVSGNDVDIVATAVFDATNNKLDPGETVELVVTIANNGAYPLTDLHCELNSLDGLITVPESIAVFTNIAVGAQADNSTQSFDVTADVEALVGMSLPMQLHFWNSEGYEEDERFNIEIGEVSVGSALGPDAGGYVCVDSWDTGIPYHPTYNWIEIDDRKGGNGTDTGIVDDAHDYNNWLDDVKVVESPFDFEFYGAKYDSITISSNGFISLGSTRNSAFRNWYMPGAMGPAPMIAPFWDDLDTGQHGAVYYKHDTNLNIFIVEWSDVVHRCATSTMSNFQLILYDPVYYPTTTGNVMIKFQYKNFNNIDSNHNVSGYQGNYATIGIQDHTEQVGIQYTYNNVYPTAAHTLQDQSALLFTGRPIIYPKSFFEIGDVLVNDTNGNGLADAGEEVGLGIYLNNIGLQSGINTIATLSTLDPYITIVQDTASYSRIPSEESGINNTDYIIQISEDCPDGHNAYFNLHSENNDGEWEHIFALPINKPGLKLSSGMINDIDENNNGIMDPGETVKMIVNIANTNLAPAFDVNLNLSSPTGFVTITDEEGYIDKIDALSNMQYAFELSIDEVAQTEDIAEFHLVMNSSGGFADTLITQASISVWGFETDLEEDHGNLSSFSGWQWGDILASVGAHSGTKGWATNRLSMYPNRCDMSLTTPAMYIGGYSELTFYHYYNSQSGMDGGNVKVSTNNGLTWEIIYPEGGYPTPVIDEGANGVGGEPGYSGISLWEQARFDLSQFSMQTIMIKWQFGSDEAVNGFGWAIDDVVVTGGQEKSAIITGNVSVANPSDDTPIDLTKAVVSTGGYSTHPDSLGDYTLYASFGLYDVTATYPGVRTGVINQVQVESGDLIQDQDFELTALAPIYGFDFYGTAGVYRFTWHYNFPITTASSRNTGKVKESADRDAFLGFNVYQKIASGPFVKIDSLLEFTEYVDTLTTDLEYKYYVTVQYDEGESVPSETIFLTNTAADNEGVVKFENKLKGNYPNPFNPRTNIAFSLKQKGNVELKVYNVKGEYVKTVFAGEKSAGEHVIEWKGTNYNNKSVGSGVYFFKLQTKDYSSVKKGLLLK